MHGMPKGKKPEYSQLDWLPIDHRLIPDIFRFSRVRGWARIFLGLEMSLASIIVLCTFYIAFLKAIGN